MDHQLTEESLNKYLCLLKDDARPEGVLRLQDAQDNLEYLMEYVNQRDSLENRKEVLALEFRKDHAESGTVPRRDLNVLTPNTSVKTIPTGDDRFQVTETGLVLQRRTIPRQSFASLQSSKFEVVRVWKFGERMGEATVKCVPGTREGSLLVEHEGSLAWTTPGEMVLEFRDFNAAFYLVSHQSIDTSLVESGRPLPCKLRRFIDAGDNVNSTVVSILHLDQTKSLLHVFLEAPEIPQRNKFGSSENSDMWRRSPERSSRVDDGELGQSIERNIHRIVDKRTSQKAFSVLVKKFGFEQVREAFDSALETHVPVQNTNSSNFLPVTTRDLSAHQITINSSTTSFSSATRHAPSVDSTWSRLSEVPKELLDADLGTGPLERPYKKPITEASWGDSHEVVEEKNEQSNVAEVEVKPQSGLLRRNSESQSIVSCQTQETTIHELTFPVRILNEIREITRALQKVAIVVSTQTDGKTLADFIASKGYKTKLVSREDLDAGSYDHVIYTNQVIIVPIEDWKMMRKEYKQKTTYLIISLREGQTDGTCTDFQEFHHFEGLQQIPFIREELPRTYSSISDEMPDLPLRQRQPLNTEPPTLLETPSRPARPRTPPTQPISSQTVTSIRTVSGHQQETAGQMFVNLQNFAKQIISELVEEARAQGVQDLEQLSHEHYRSYDNFVNQLSSWISGVDKTFMKDSVRVYLLKETLRAVSFVYLIGSENTKGLIAPSISKLYEQSGRVYGPDQGDMKAIDSMEEIMNSPPESFDYEETVFFQGFIEKLKEWHLRSFHGVVIVHSRINVWAISELLRRHPEFQETTIFPFYSHSKDPSVYGANKELRMTRTKRSEVLKEFNESTAGILVTVSVLGIETELTDLDLLILFGCTSAVPANSIKATKKWYIEIGFGTTGRIADIS